MLFNSFDFLIFFPAVVAVYFATPLRYRWMLLLAGSYYFYACWKAEYLVLIMASTLVDYWAAQRMGAYEDRAERRPYLLLSLASNLGLLFAFKYLDFFSESVQAVFDVFNLFINVPAFDLLLPVGISFYTFQTLSYSIDVYRGKQSPEQHLGIFALYVSFFPQLVAGPIERSTHLLPQFHPATAEAAIAERRGLPRGVRASSANTLSATAVALPSGIASRFDYDRVTSGLKLMLWGFFKKLVIADRLAIYVNAVYAAPEAHSGTALLIATYFFAFQIYCDFSAYSDIAIGAARVLGFDLMENFRRPYFSKSISEFWNRWHISLSSWFRDYLYIPLGGNRVVKSRWYANLFIVFLVSGLWHGAAWTFVIWGALHGLYLMTSMITAPLRERLWANITTLAAARVPNVRAAGFQLFRIDTLRQWLAAIVTFHLVLVAWVFFRAESVADAVYVLASMWRLDGPILVPGFDGGALLVAVAAIGFMEMIHFAERGSSIETVLDARPAWMRWGFYYTLAFAILVFGVFSQQQFIYFQF